MANTQTNAALKNEKHEKFCNFTSAGMSAADAYLAAGYVASSRDSARANAHKLLRHPTVVGRLLELKPVSERVAQKTAERVAQVLENSIAARVDRLLTYVADYLNLCELQRCRANDPENQDVVGIRTGLLAVSQEMVGKVIYKVAKYDSAVERDKLAIKKQYAIEMGEFTEKTDSKFKFESMKDLLERGTPEQLQAGLAELKEWRAKNSTSVN